MAHKGTAAQPQPARFGGNRNRAVLATVISRVRVGIGDPCGVVPFRWRRQVQVIVNGAGRSQRRLRCFPQHYLSTPPIAWEQATSRLARQ